MGNDSNIEEAAEVVVFHTELQPVEPDTRIVLRATKFEFSVEDIDKIAELVTDKVGIEFSGRVVLENDHKLLGETLIEFYPNINKEKA